MKSSLEEYRPPSYVRRRANPPETVPIPEPEADTGRDAFETARQKLETMKERWAETLKKPEDTDIAFIHPDPDLTARLRPVASSPAAAVEELKETFSLETLEALTLLRNPGIESARKDVRATLESFSQVTNLDEILRQYSVFTEGLMTGISPMRGAEPVRTRFPFPGVTALKGQAVDQAVRAAVEALEIARRDAVTDIRKAYWNLVYLRKAREITDETLGLFRNLESVADTRYRAGNTSFQDVIKIGIRTSILQEELTTLAERQRNLETGLLEILELPPESEVGRPADRTPAKTLPTLDRLYELARERRQELRRIRAMIGRSERMIEMAETMVLPPFTFEFSYYEDTPMQQVGSAATQPSFPTNTEASRGSGLPKSPWYGKNDAWLRQTRQNLAGLRANLRKAEAATHKRVRMAWFSLDKALRETALYENTVVDMSRSALDVSTRGYESGAVTFADVIGSYSTWLEVRTSLARKRSDIGVARAELEQVVGTTLE
ncbi:MAG: TolC family protein [Thermodesulfobacteriota bacterium]